MTRIAAAVLVLAVVGCTHAQPAATAPAPAPAQLEPRPAPPEEISGDDLVDHSGDSPQTAISVPVDSPNGGVDFENQWIFNMWGRFRRVGGGTGTLEGRRYNIVKIELFSGDRKSVYFDITELWAKSLQDHP